MAGVLTHLQRLKDGCLHALSARLTHWTKPLTSSLPLQTLADLSRSKSELIAQNALLRQQLIILRREVKRPAFTRTDRILLVLLARLVRTWHQALLIVQPDTRLAASIGSSFACIGNVSPRRLLIREIGRGRHDRRPMLGWRVPLREATPYGQAPRYLIHDHDSKFGSYFDRVATTSNIKLLKTPYHAPRANAVCERFAQECAARMSGSSAYPS